MRCDGKVVFMVVVVRWWIEDAVQKSKERRRFWVGRSWSGWPLKQPAVQAQVSEGEGSRETACADGEASERRGGEAV